MHVETKFTIKFFSLFVMCKPHLRCGMQNLGLTQQYQYTLDGGWVLHSHTSLISLHITYSSYGLALAHQWQPLHRLISSLDLNVLHCIGQFLDMSRHLCLRYCYCFLANLSELCRHRQVICLLIRRHSYGAPAVRPRARDGPFCVTFCP